jgi:DNA-binding CsgD family transcriptional regulator
MRTIYLSVLLLFCANLFAQKSVQFLKETQPDFKIEEANDSDFKPFTRNNFGLENGAYWFKISNKANDGSVLHIPTSHVNDLKLFSASKKQIEEISYTRYPSFRLDEFEEYPVYLYVNFEKEAYFPIQITSEENFAKANQQSLFKLGAYYGFAIMVIIINLMCFFLFDEKVFLYYSAVLTTLTLSFFYSDGLFRLMGYDNIFTNTYLEPLLHLSVALFAAHFATKFLKLDDLMPKLKWITTTLIGVACISFLSYWITENWLYAAIGNGFIWAVLLNYLIAGATLFRQKVYARFYVVAYSLLFVLMVDYYVLTGFGITFLGISAFHIKVAGILEMLVLTYAIMYRMRAIKEENEMMQIEMRLYLKRIELLRSPDNIQMVDDLYLENLINLHDLNNLETKILQYISKGKDNAKIAVKLNISEKEVEKITKQLYKKLDISEHIQEDQRMIDEQPDYVYN